MKFLHVSLLCIFAQGLLYEFWTSSVHTLNSANFDRRVTANRDKYASIVHFYRENDGDSENWAGALQALAEDWQGVYIIATVDCGMHEGLCEQHVIRQYPSLKIYPPYPAPVETYEGEISAKAINAYVAKYVQNYAVELNENNYKTFLEENLAITKVLLFTEKQGVPTLFKALSVVFKNNLSLGVARPELTDAASQFKITKYPTIVVYKTALKTSEKYSGDLKYKNIFDWLNVHSEAFGSGKETETKSNKPWMSQKVPQLHRLSAKDICYQSGGLCGVYFLTAPPSEDLVKISAEISLTFKKETSIKFMWVDTQKDSNFFAAFTGMNEGELAFLKVGKRNKFIAHAGDFDYKSVERTVSTIMTGDGKFITIKGALPELSIKLD